MMLLEYAVSDRDRVTWTLLFSSNLNVDLNIKLIFKPIHVFFTEKPRVSKQTQNKNRPYYKLHHGCQTVVVVHKSDIFLR